jgi:hypothetical protein
MNEEQEFAALPLGVRWMYQYVILFQKPLSEFRELAELVPEALQTPVYGGLVIHHACINVRSFEVIQYLVESFPESLMTPAGVSSRFLGKLPIHCVVNHPGASLEIVE